MSFIDNRELIDNRLLFHIIANYLMSESSLQFDHGFGEQIELIKISELLSRSEYSWICTFLPYRRSGRVESDIHDYNNKSNISIRFSAFSKIGWYPPKVGNIPTEND